MYFKTKVLLGLLPEAYAPVDPIIDVVIHYYK